MSNDNFHEWTQLRIAEIDEANRQRASQMAPARPTERARLEKTLSKTQSENEELRRENLAFQHEIQVLKRQIAELRETVDDLNETKLEALQQVDAEIDRCVELKRQIKNLRKGLSREKRKSAPPR